MMLVIRIFITSDKFVNTEFLDSVRMHLNQYK